MPAPTGHAFALDEKLKRLRSSVRLADTRIASGRLIAVIGTIIHAELRGARVGELCELRDPDKGIKLFAEVVGIDGDVVHLAPFGNATGLSVRTDVVALGRVPSIMAGKHLLGAVIDASGQPLPGFGDMPKPGPDATFRPLQANPPDPMSRKAIENILPTGIRSIDSLLTVGEGQRVGIFGNAGGGKSTLISEIVTQAEADIFIIALVGERGREVGDFVRKTLGPARRGKSIVVAATSDRPSVERLNAAMLATAIAEHFRDQGLKVLLIVDSVTRLARALREVGLAAGEPPTRRGFPPSVFSALPKLFERAGNGAVGSITAFYTVLVEGDITADPVSEESRSLLDGHIVLSDRLAAKNHYPAIDVLESRSRIADSIITKEHKQSAYRMRELMAKYNEVELLIRVGEYRKGNDKSTDEAVDRIDNINDFLKQPVGEDSKLDSTLKRLKKVVS
jgi:ATP synthase in type III secretion protein N